MTFSIGKMGLMLAAQRALQDLPEQPQRPQAKAMHTGSRAKIPGILVRHLRQHQWRLRELLDLGCGDKTHAEGYAVLKEYGVKAVHLVDPDLHVFGSCRAPKLHEHKSTEKVPLGLPAIMSHPGFTLQTSDHERYTRLQQPIPTWAETLSQLQPPLIVWSSYLSSEHEEDSAWLQSHGYDVIARHEPHESREWFITPPIRYCDTVGIAKRRGT